MHTSVAARGGVVKEATHLVLVISLTFNHIEFEAD